MRFRRGRTIEREAKVAEEPKVLGYEIDQESAALYAEFAQGRGYDDIYELWKDPEITDPTIRQRALATLTAPWKYELPFPHPGQSVGRLLHISEEMDGKPTTSLRDRLSGRDDLAAELAQGVMYWLHAPINYAEPRSIDSRQDYQRIILELLPITEESVADQLYELYPKNDIEPYYNMDFASGYNPLKALLRDSAVPRKYKDMGLSEWFTVAELEEQGIREPREEHERAAVSMANFVESLTYDKDADSETVSQIISVLENQTKPGKAYVEGYYLSRIADHLDNDDVRFSFAWRHIVEKQDEELSDFRVESERDLDFVRWLQDEAERRGLSNIDSDVDVLIDDYHAKHRAEIARKAAEIALRDRLRAKSSS